MNQLGVKVQTVWKYCLPPNGEEIEIELPPGAQIVATHQQLNDERIPAPCMWVLVNPDPAREHWQRRRFRVIPTGQQLPPDGHYVGAVFMFNAAYVLHVIEVLG